MSSCRGLFARSLPSSGLETRLQHRTEGVIAQPLPRPATGVGSLQWEGVSPLIGSQLADVDATIYVYSQFVPCRKANETLI